MAIANSRRLPWLFGYSRAEIEDRLALITAALDDPDTPDADRRPLRSAAGKLERWRETLG